MIFCFVHIRRLLICILLSCMMLCGCAAPAYENNVSANAVDPVLEEFIRLTGIPRMSGHEEAVSQYLIDRAHEMGFEARRDEQLNVIIDIPASEGCESAPLTILQAHTDMVCAAEDGVRHDPLTDAIKVINDGKTVTADGTTLGADDGIGISVIMYLLQDETLTHGPLRILFTTCEETDMSGAAGVKTALLADAEYLINVDWETGGSVCTSSAGMRTYMLSRKIERENVDGIAATLRISGLMGGHSGVDIGAGRANAVTELANMLTDSRREGIEFCIADMQGGVADNAIPAFAEALLVFADQEAKTRFGAYLLQAEERFAKEYGNVERGFEIRLEDVEPPALVLSDGDCDRMLAFIAGLPYGVHSMSPYVDGLVESSSNVGVVNVDERKIEIAVSFRSSSNDSMQTLLDSVELMCGKAGFDMYETSEPAPAWEVNPNSRLLDIITGSYREVSGEEMLISPVHASLECGWFAEKAPQLDMVSVGPTVYGAHTTEEALEIGSIPPLVETIRLSIARIAGEG